MHLSIIALFLSRKRNKTYKWYGEVSTADKTAVGCRKFNSDVSLANMQVKQCTCVMRARGVAGLTRLPVTEEIAGSNPVGPAMKRESP